MTSSRSRNAGSTDEGAAVSVTSDSSHLSAAPSALDEIHNLNKHEAKTEGEIIGFRLISTTGRNLELAARAADPTDSGGLKLTSPQGDGSDGLTDLNLSSLAGLTGVGSQELELSVQHPFACETELSVSSCEPCDGSGETLLASPSVRSVDGSRLQVESVGRLSRLIVILPRRRPAARRVVHTLRLRNFHGASRHGRVFCSIIFDALFGFGQAAGREEV